MEEGIGLNEVKDKEGGVGRPISLNKKEKEKIFPRFARVIFRLHSK